MIITIADISHIPGILHLLSQVLEIHADIRPDLFISGKTKYTEADLKDMIQKGDPRIYIAEEEDRVAGYAFCMLQESPATYNTYARKELYIDDLCVDETLRGKHIASALFDHVKKEAAAMNCDAITLNVWAGNTGAERFYEKMGMLPRKTMMELPLDQ